MDLKEKLQLSKECIGIVNQLFDLAEVPVKKRQEINDRADKYLLDQVLRLLHSSLQLEDKYDELSRLGTDLIKAIENKVPYIQLPDDEVLYTSLHKLKQEIKDNL